LVQSLSVSTPPVFNSAYDSYFVEVDYVSLNLGSIAYYLRMRNAGVDYSAASTYQWMRWGTNQAGTGQTAVSGADTLYYLALTQVALSNAELTAVTRILNPYSSTRRTKFIDGRSDSQTGLSGAWGWAVHNGTMLGAAQCDSFTLFNSSAVNMSGVIRVYGRRTVESS
jgi:hypothetical protein